MTDERTWNMGLLSDWGFFVKPGREDEFRVWLHDNESRLALEAPKGFEYVGTFLPLWRHESEVSEYHQVWKYGSGSPLNLRQAGGDQSTFAGIVREFLGFIDETRDSEEGYRLYKTVDSERETQPVG